MPGMYLRVGIMPSLSPRSISQTTCAGTSSSNSAMPIQTSVVLENSSSSRSVSGSGAADAPVSRTITCWPACAIECEKSYSRSRSAVMKNPETRTSACPDLRASKASTRPGATRYTDLVLSRRATSSQSSMVNPVQVPPCCIAKGGAEKVSTRSVGGTPCACSDGAGKPKQSHADNASRRRKARRHALDEPISCRLSLRQGRQSLAQRFAVDLHEAPEWLVHLEDEEDRARSAQGEQHERAERRGAERREQAEAHEQDGEPEHQHDQEGDRNAAAGLFIENQARLQDCVEGLQRLGFVETLTLGGRRQRADVLVDRLAGIGRRESSFGRRLGLAFTPDAVDRGVDRDPQIGARLARLHPIPIELAVERDGAGRHQPDLVALHLEAGLGRIHQQAEHEAGDGADQAAAQPYDVLGMGVEVMFRQPAPQQGAEQCASDQYEADDQRRDERAHAVTPPATNSGSLLPTMPKSS